MINIISKGNIMYEGLEMREYGVKDDFYFLGEYFLLLLKKLKLINLIFRYSFY